LLGACAGDGASPDAGTAPRLDATAIVDAAPRDATAPADLGFDDAGLIDGHHGSTFELTAPALGAVWGAVRTIRWSVADSVPAIVVIRAARTATSAFDLVVEPGMATQWPNLGTYAWDTRAVPDGSSWRLRVSLTFGGVVTEHAESEAFVVDNTAPVLALDPIDPMNPNGPTVSGVVPLRWRTVDANPLSVHVELIGSGSAVTIAAGVPDEGELDWDTSTATVGDYRLRLTATDAAGNAASPVVSSTITITR